jgi:hypothetical protein
LFLELLAHALEPLLLPLLVLLGAFLLRGGHAGKARSSAQEGIVSASLHQFFLLPFGEQSNQLLMILRTNNGTATGASSNRSELLLRSTCIRRMVAWRRHKGRSAGLI